MRRMFVSMIVPPRGQRTLPTLPGLTLIVMAIGIGMAAYNASSNILFIALSLLLSSLIASGILSWLNFRGVCWRLLIDPPYRAGESCHVRVEIRNHKRFLPTYAIGFQVETTRSRRREVLMLTKRLEPGGEVQLDFTFMPEGRGVETVKLTRVISHFPFGFLRKTIPGLAMQEIMVWPQRVAYRFDHLGTAQRHFSGDALNKPGHGSEVINLRDYRHGDSHRQIHWKASARLRTLVVQQFAAEHHAGFVIEVNSDKRVWVDDAQFELLCSFVSSLAEDLFRMDQLHGVRINGAAYQKVARRADVDFFQDQLATLERVGDNGRSLSARGRSIVTFEPNPDSGIHAFIGGKKAATA
jgi:uncharacterized protein (DUF58 family)